MTDLDELSWRELLRLKKDLVIDRGVARRQAHWPAFQAEVDADFSAELAAVDVRIAAHRDRAEVERALLQRSKDNPIAADLWLLLADAKNADELYRIAENITGRFAAAASGPAPEPEDFSDAVPAIDRTNPARPFETPPAPEELRRQIERQRTQGHVEHDDPLAQRYTAEQREQERRRIGAELAGQATPRHENAEARRLRNLWPVEAADIYQRLHEEATE